MQSAALESIEVSSETVVELRATDIGLRDSLLAGLQIHPITATVLAARGIEDPHAAQAFLNPSLKEHLCDPTEIKNCKEAAALILDAISKGELIAIYSDFDVDGITSGSQLYLFLKAVGADVLAYVPNRFVEGYGLAASAVEGLAQRGVNLLITVDCGISNQVEIALAKRRGMRVLVVDHHQPPAELPPADVIVDPAQEGCPFQPHKLAAAGLVWMLLIVLRGELRARGQHAAPDPKEFLDLAAIGTICDMVPLTGLNRLIASRGMEALQKSSRIGLEALKQVCGIKYSRLFTAGHVGFALGPRINAAGRLGDANEVIHLLTTTDSIRAKSIAEAIDRLNDDRRRIENYVKDSCLRLIGPEASAPAFAVFGADFHVGVIGIAAQRIVEEYHRPAAVMGPADVDAPLQPDSLIKGSVRSISGFKVAEVLASLGHLLVSHGGHDAAGGFSVRYDLLESFQEAFVEAARQRLAPEMLRRRVKADAVVQLTEIDYQLAEEFGRLAPFGVGNPAPVLIAEDVTIHSATMIGEKHLRLRIGRGECVRNAIAWNAYGNPLLRKGQRATIAFQVELNSYQGVSTVQLVVKEVWK